MCSGRVGAKGHDDFSAPMATDPPQNPIRDGPGTAWKPHNWFSDKWDL